ncbi:MAG: KH domain-containing protein [Chloroflexi bacterium]|nr:KH domain-containing protein [Chloroflexota bacterium]
MLRDLIEYIALQLVDDVDAVSVSERVRGDRTVITLHVHESDMGRVIGREGRIANAMRTLLRSAGASSDRHVVLEVR